MALFRRSSSSLEVILDRPDDILCERLRSNPLTTKARHLNNSFPEANDGTATVVCNSNTHNARPRLLLGDMLIHAPSKGHVYDPRGVGGLG
ncbi:hypothetical protein CGRA01v4_00541 [Colletotrichum graminicola]|nr:hypothetical protein CGRA01v4_00541 [Colletotrichum graminicola]